MTPHLERTVAVCLPYAASIRDFVNSGAFQTLRRVRGLRLVVYTLNPELPELAVVRESGTAIRPFVAHRDGRAERLLKRIYPFFFTDRFSYVRLALARRPGTLVAARALAGLRRLVGTARFLRLLGRVLLRLYRGHRRAPQLEEGLALVIGTRSLINSLDYGILAEATARKIPILTLSGSWDNFTTKGFFPFPARCTVVWNEKMRRELVDLFDVSHAGIRIAGYPRADLLRRSVLPLSTGEYLARLGLPQYRRFILYSASYGELSRTPAHEAPLEYLAARQVCEGLRRVLSDDTCILVRLHPFSRETDRDFFQMEHCHVFVPGRADMYVERVMGLADEEHLATQLAKAECVVSVASTISLDALVLDRPVLNLDFDPLPGLRPEWSIRRFYHFDHFRDLLSATRLPLARSPQEAVDFVAACLTGTYRSPVDRDAFARLYVPPDSAEFPARLAVIVGDLLP